MQWRWDVRPPEFLALSTAERHRVWNHCYWKALRRPRLFVPALVMGCVLPLIMLAFQAAFGRSTTWPGFIARTSTSILVMAAITLAFARYAAHALRDELRSCAVGCCLNCWYDLTGNESGVCPECGTARQVRHV